MATRRNTVELIPSAKRLVLSLRDLGYDFKHAVADLVDNSVAAGASRVDIQMHFDGSDSWLRISDNGSGMTGPTINEAMRFGTEREYGDDELGKFGLGLKTASLSQCARFTVASRQSSQTRRVEVRQWDLDHVARTNRWEIIDVPARDRPDHLIEPLQTSTGTVILWEQLDRVLGYRIPWGKMAQKGFLKLAEELDLHLGMVFHRFITGEARRRKKLKITIGDTEVEPWDPFAREEKATIELPCQEFEVQGDSGTGIVALSPFILPAQDQFSSMQAFNRYAGPAKWNYQQGFYVYRADRMIQSGGWSYMRTSDEHTKLARVAIDFRPDLDSAFDLNVAKAKVNLPSSFRHEIKPEIDKVVKQARKVYSSSGSGGASASSHRPSGSQRGPLVGRGSPSPSGGGANTRADTDQSSSELHRSADADTPPRTAQSYGSMLESAAKRVGETEALNRIREAFSTDNPVAARQIGWQK